MGLGALGRAELGADEGVVPLALAEFAKKSLASQLVDTFARRPSLDQGVADVQEDSTESHTGIVSTLHARLRTARIHREVAATGVAWNRCRARWHTRRRAPNDARRSGIATGRHARSRRNGRSPKVTPHAGRSDDH